MPSIKLAKRPKVNIGACPAIPGPDVIKPRTCRRQWIRVLPLAAAAALLFPYPARAAPVCTVNASSAIAFGVYDPLSATPLDATGTIVYECPPGQVVRIDLATGSSGTFTYRTMKSGASVLRYNLYLDALRTIVWGNGTSGTQSGPRETARGSGTQTTAYVFGRVPPLQDAEIGAYADLVIVTVNF